MNTPLHFAVMGNPIQHSYSPLLHSLFAKQAGLDINYEKMLVPLEDFESAVHTFFEQGGKGLNITIPFKLRAHELARGNLSRRAQSAGSVNTLWMEEGQLHGCNTDGIGMVNDIRRQGIALEGKKILLLGAGGAARGVIMPLLESGCQQLQVVNRTAAKATELARQCQTNLPQYANIFRAGGFEHIQGQWDIVINATSSSLQHHTLPLPAGLFTQDSLAYDMIYTPDNNTPFLQQARKDGAGITSDGLGMLVYQGAESFFIWNHIRVNPVPVLETLRQQLISG